jgi:hypothetical protein
MKILRKIWEEIKIVFRTASYFAIVFILMMVMKKLYLKDYNIEFYGMSQALIGALIMSKVIILMEMISFGKWVLHQPPIVDVLIRTVLYTVGVAVVIILEKAFEKRHEVPGFGNAVKYILFNRDVYHVWATTIGAAASIFVYNAFSIVQKLVGKNGLARLFFSTPLIEVEPSRMTQTPSVAN